MDPTIVSALSAVLGSVVGGAASIITTLISQNTQIRRARLQADIEQREKLYSDFINTCCKLAVDSYQRSLDSAETILPAYALLNQVRLFSSDAVLAAAEQTIQSILDRYFSKNMPTEQLYNLASSGKADFDLVRGFAEACRQELKTLRIRA